MTGAISSTVRREAGLYQNTNEGRSGGQDIDPGSDHSDISDDLDIGQNLAETQNLDNIDDEDASSIDDNYTDDNDGEDIDEDLDDHVSAASSGATVQDSEDSGEESSYNMVRAPKKQTPARKPKASNKPVASTKKTAPAESEVPPPVRHQLKYCELEAVTLMDGTKARIQRRLQVACELPPGIDCRNVTAIIVQVNDSLFARFSWTVDAKKWKTSCYGPGPGEAAPQWMKQEYSARGHDLLSHLAWLGFDAETKEIKGSDEVEIQLNYEQ